MMYLKWRHQIFRKSDRNSPVIICKAFVRLSILIDMEIFGVPKIGILEFPKN